MAQLRIIKPTSWRPVDLPSGHQVSITEPLETSNEVLRSLDNARVISTLVNSGVLEATYDPDPELGVEAPTSIDPEPGQNPPVFSPDTTAPAGTMETPPETDPIVEGAIPGVSDETPVRTSKPKSSTPAGA